MEISEAKDFLKSNHHGCLVARKKDGSLQMTLVSPVLGADGNVIITARNTTYKVKNIKRNPQVSLLVYGDQFHGSKYIQIDGRAGRRISSPDWLCSSISATPARAPNVPSTWRFWMSVNIRFEETFR